MRQGADRGSCLILTARDALHDRVEGLEAGADDYLAKPFAMEELVARVRVVASSCGASVAAPGMGRHHLNARVRRHAVRAAEYRTGACRVADLLALVRKQGGVVRRNRMESAGWGLSDTVTPNALDVALHRLRRKLHAIGSPLTDCQPQRAGPSVKKRWLNSLALKILLAFIAGALLSIGLLILTGMVVKERLPGMDLTDYTQALARALQFDQHGNPVGFTQGDQYPLWIYQSLSEDVAYRILDEKGRVMLMSPGAQARPPIAGITAPQEGEL